MEDNGLKAGDTIPEHTFMTLVDGSPTPMKTSDVFAGKRVALFAVPGAFTPGCSKTHCPSFVANIEKLKAKGVDTVACTAVNDCFVMDAWAEDQRAKGKILMLADGDGTFAKAVGLVKETGPFGGTRSKRYALLANDGKVEFLGIDEKAIEKSTAESLLAHL